MRTINKATIWTPMAGLALLGCVFAVGGNTKAVSSSSTTPTAYYGGTLTESIMGEPRTLNLWMADDSMTYTALESLFEPLNSRNPLTLRSQARLAELPAVSADKLRWTFTLRPGLKWSDGHPVTADDVVFTLNVIYDKKLNGNFRQGMLIDVWNSRTKRMEQRPLGYRKLDSRTIEFRFPRPYAPARGMLEFPIAPRHKLEAAWRAGRFQQAWGLNTPVKEMVSSGPWILDSYVPGQRLTYRRNPQFWRKDAQGRPLPYLDGYRTLLVEELQHLRRNFDSGKSDVLPLQPKEFAQRQARLTADGSNKGYRLYDLGPSWGITFLCFNMNPAAKVDANKRRLYQNVKFRRAVSHAINRSAMVKSVFAGQAQPLYGPVTAANTLFYNPRAPRYLYDVAKARQLLRKAGLRDDNKNGLFEWNKREVNISILTNIENTMRREMGNLVVRDLRKVGLKATLTPVGFNTLINRLDASPYEWEATLIGFTGGPEPDSGRNIWHSSGNLHMWHPLQKTPATPWEAEVDELFRRGAITINEAERKAIYHRWQVIMAEQQPMTFLVTPHVFTAIRSRFGNIKPTSLGGSLWNLEEIFDRQATRTQPSNAVATPLPPASTTTKH